MAAPGSGAVLMEMQQQNGLVTFYAMSQQRLLGVLIEQRMADGHISLVAHNAGTTLPLSRLVLGLSTKRDDCNTAGNWGEGMKVEINCLVNRGAAVHYRSCNTRWTFVHDAQAVLQVTSHREPAFTPDLTVYVRQLRPDVEPLPVDQYLFLQPAPTCTYKSPVTKSVMSGCQVLLDPRHIGRVFLHGILIAPPETTSQQWPTFGINFAGSKQAYKSLGITRDRNTIQASHLAPQVARVVAHCAQTMSEADVLPLLRVAYDTLDSHPRSEFTQHCCWLASSTPAQFRSVMLAEFRRRFPEVLDKALLVPLAKGETDEKKELEYLEYHPRFVGEALLAVLRLADGCPTVESAWQHRDNAFLQLPDFRFDPHSVDGRLAEEIIRDLRDIFPLFLPASVPVQWKVFPGNNNNANSHVVYRSRTRETYLIDVAQLHPQAVHKRLVQLDPSSVCSPTGSDTDRRCICVKLHVVESMLTVLVKQKSINREAYHRKMVIYYMKSSTSNALPTPPAQSTSLQSDPSNAAHQHEHDENRVEHNTNQSSQGHRTVSGVGSRAARSAAVTPMMASPQVVEASEVESIMGISHVATSTAMGAPPAQVDCSDPLNAPTTQADVRALQRRIETEAHSGCSNPRHMRRYNAPGLDRPLYVPDDLFERAGEMLMQASALVNFNYRRLRELYEQVLRRSPNFFVYYDPAGSAIAFNQANTLWYNLAAQRAATDRPRDAVEAWYLTICHEHAHAVFRNHEAGFAAVLSIIALKYAAPFRQYQAAI